MPLPTYEPGQAHDYINKQGWKAKQAGTQINLERCPFCGHGGWKFYVNSQTGLWDCKVASCNRKGNWFTFLREMGDLDALSARSLPYRNDKTATAKPKRRQLAEFQPFETALTADADAQAYLTERGLTMETAQAWHFGVKEKEGIKYLMIPYLQNGEIADVKYRSLPPAPKGYSRMGGGESILYGEHLLGDIPRDERKVLYLCEGELDAVTLHQHGYRPVLSTTTGAGSFKARWFDLIIDYNPQVIVVVYDSDVAGQNGAAALLKKFDEREVRNVVLPVKDVNEFFLSHTNEEFDALVSASAIKDVEGVHTLTNVLDTLESKLFLGTSAFDGFRSQFPELNELMAGGYWASQVTTISGTSGVGKTSFLLQELYWLAEKQQIPTYLICLEMPTEMVLRKLLEHRFHVPKLELTYQHIQQFRPVLESVPFYLTDKVRNLGDLEKVIRAAVKRYDLRVIGFDNINYFIRSHDRQTQEVSIAMKLFKELAVDLGVTFLNISQPKKFDSDERVMTSNDLRDAAAIEQDSDTVLLLYRRKLRTGAKDFGKNPGFKGNHSPFTLLRADKTRYSAGGEMYLYFHGDISTYRALTVEEKDRLLHGNSEE